MTDFALAAPIRTEMVAEMLKMAEGTTKAIRAQRTAIEALMAWYEGGQQGEEPYAEDVDGVTWKMACAISSDLGCIYREKLPAGTYSNQYAGEYVKLRKTAISTARARQARSQKTGMDTLRSMLTI